MGTNARSARRSENRTAGKKSRKQALATFKRIAMPKKKEK